jgi:hypothetical protein
MVAAALQLAEQGLLAGWTRRAYPLQLAVNLEPCVMCLGAAMSLGVTLRQAAAELLHAQTAQIAAPAGGGPARPAHMARSGISASAVLTASSRRFRPPGTDCTALIRSSAALTIAVRPAKSMTGQSAGQQRPGQTQNPQGGGRPLNVLSCCYQPRRGSVAIFATRAAGLAWVGACWQVHAATGRPTTSTGVARRAFRA